MKSSLTCLLLFCFFLNRKSPNKTSSILFPPFKTSSYWKVLFYRHSRPTCIISWPWTPDRLLAPFLTRSRTCPPKPQVIPTGEKHRIGRTHRRTLHFRTFHDVCRHRRHDRIQPTELYAERITPGTTGVGNGFIGGTPGSLQLWKEIKEGNIRSESFSLKRQMGSLIQHTQDLCRTSRCLPFMQ